jgi:hypothetical protein
MYAAFEDEKREHFEVIADMTRQYKAMKEELLRRVNDLETSLAQAKGEIGTRPRNIETRRQ